MFEIVSVMVMLFLGRGGGGRGGGNFFSGDKSIFWGKDTS